LIKDVLDGIFHSVIGFGSGKRDAARHCNNAAIARAVFVLRVFCCDFLSASSGGGPVSV